MSTHAGWEIKELWEKYEDIAMHFNDLIIRLRTQALAGVATLSTLVGVFAKSDIGHFSYTWEIAGFVFIALAIFWIAIWILDFSYYNPLLIGAVAALRELEAESQTSKTTTSIRLSTLVEKSVSEGVSQELNLTTKQKARIIWGRWAFYILVLFALAAGAGFSFYEHYASLELICRPCD